jgi:V8-like Glu-specific endopeptidase
MKRTLLFAVAFTALLALISSVSVPKTYAQESSVQGMVGIAAQDQAESQAEIEAYWTPERLQSAKPMELHPDEVGANGLPIVNKIPTEAGGFVSIRGAAPSVAIGTELNRVLIPGGLKLQAEEPSGVTPFATSSFGAFFTTGRVFPNAATTTYPYRAIGRLFGSDPRTGGGFSCSASVLRFRVVVTAGHCVAHGSTTAADRYFYHNFMFIPSYNAGAAPNGTWTWSFVTTTNAWFDSGAVPNQQDVGMLVMVDRSGLKIGQVTGFLGYRYCTGTNCGNSPIAKNNLTMFGYPGNLDSANRMEENNAQTFESGGSNTWIYGSAMREGSSGGPWIQDFGVAPAGAPAGLLGNNFVEAVTSYGPISTTPMYQGASGWDSRFFTILSAACSHNAGNC